MDKQIEEFEVQYLGIDHPQYFQGVGTAFTDWDQVMCGIGDTPAEALDDALEQMATEGIDVSEIEKEEMPYAKRMKVSASEELRIDLSNEISPRDYGCDEFDEEKHDALVEERMEGIDEYPQYYVAIYWRENDPVRAEQESNYLKDLGV